MKKTVFALATFSLAASSAFAKEPVRMTEQKMDQVTAGALVNVGIVAVDLVDITNVANNNKVAVAIPVNAAAAIGVLGTAVSGAVQHPGRINQ
jgi:hypothetical protein